MRRFQAGEVPVFLISLKVGGVALNLQGDAEVSAAYSAMMSRVQTAKPEARIEGVIVSPMRAQGVEVDQVRAVDRAGHRSPVAAPVPSS